MIIDSHCHLNRLNFDNGMTIKQVIDDAEKKSVEKIISVATTLEEVNEIKAIASKFHRVYYTVGVHPCETDCIQPQNSEIIIEHSKDKSCVAIGETGLDYYFNDGLSIKAQQDKFEIHIAAAQHLNKPVIVHTRQAKEDTLAILKNSNIESCGGVLHCFTEDWSMAKKAIDMGLYLSFSGIVTFKNAQTVQKVAKKTPIDRLLIETDSPYLTPVPYRGKSNYPKHVYDVAKFLAKLRNDPFDDFCRATYNNTCNLFF